MKWLELLNQKKRIYKLICLGKKNGRGAYICKNENCLNKIVKSKRLEKNFEVKIEDEFYESLRGIILG